jgi:hypothetical protein
MSEISKIFKTLKPEGETPREVALGALFNSVHGDWVGNLETVQGFNNDVETLEQAGLIIIRVEGSRNSEKIVALSKSGGETANRVK